MSGIERRSGLTPRVFAEEYLHPHRPVVLTDTVAAWPALRRWTPAQLRERLAGRELTLDGKRYRFEDFIDQVVAADPARPVPYLNQHVLCETIPELLEDLQPEPWFFSPNWLPGRYGIRFIDQWFNQAPQPQLFIGAKGGGFRVLHYDHLHLHAFSVQIHGSKRFYVYPPEQTPFLYATKNFSAVEDVVAPDLTRFPLFAQARPIIEDLHPGEVLFLPSGWWHDTRLLSTSVSISINTACASNWAAVRRDVYRDVRPGVRLLAWLLLAGVGVLRRFQEPWV